MLTKYHGSDILWFMNTLIIKAVEICGTQEALGKAVGQTQKHVWNWIHRDKRLAAEHCIPIEKATKGAIKRYELRPDIYPPEEYMHE